MLFLILLLLVILILIFLLFNNTKENFSSIPGIQIPFLLITDKNKFEDSEYKLHELGFKDISRIAPVYLENDNTTCKERNIGISELGCSYAHLSCYKKIVETNKASIILETDWDFTVSSEKLYKLMELYYNYFLRKKLDILWLGYCGNACTHAYIIGPKTCKKILDLNYCNSPIDVILHQQLCLKKQLKCESVSSEKKSDKLFGSGLILQDRKNNLGMHDMNNAKTTKWI